MILINEKVDVYNPNDISYAYSGYIPICIRLIEKAINDGWNNIKETLKKIPGETDFPKDENEMIRK